MTGVCLCLHDTVRNITVTKEKNYCKKSAIPYYHKLFKSQGNMRMVRVQFRSLLILRRKSAKKLSATETWILQPPNMLHSFPGWQMKDICEGQCFEKGLGPCKNADSVHASGDRYMNIATTRPNRLSGLIWWKFAKYYATISFKTK